MKRLRLCLILIGIAAMLAGIRFYDNGLLRVRADGIYTEYKNGTEYVYEVRPLLYKGGYARLDIIGGEAAAKQGLNELYAEVLWEERFDDMVIFYAYSPFVRDSALVLGKRVNVMVAVRDGGVAFGSPLLRGSY